MHGASNREPNYIYFSKLSVSPTIENKNGTNQYLLFVCLFICLFVYGCTCQILAHVITPGDVLRILNLPIPKMCFLEFRNDFLFGII